MHLEGVLGSGLDPLGNGRNGADPREQVLQVGGCVQNLWKKRGMDNQLDDDLANSKKVPGCFQSSRGRDP